MNIDSLIRKVVARKVASELTIDEVAAATGVNRHWLAKFIQGEIKNPTYANLTAMQRFAEKRGPSPEQRAA